MMIFNIIAILLLVGQVFSSLPVQGSISMVHDNTMSIDLRASKWSHELDELVKQLFDMEKPQVHLLINLGRKTIQVNGEIDLEQNYFKAGNNIQNTLLRKILLMQEYENYDKQSTYKNLIDYEILRYLFKEYQNFMMYDKNYSTFSSMISNPEFELEINSLISTNEYSYEYIKSIQRALLWLIKLFDIKKLRLHDDFDNISRWKLSNLQRQADFILDTLVADNERHNENLKDDKRTSKDKSDIVLSTEKTEIEKEILTEQSTEIFYETNTTEISKDKFLENISSNYITSTEEIQVTDNPELTKREDDASKSPTTVKNLIEPKFNKSIDDNIINDTFASTINPLENYILAKNETLSKQFLSIFYDNVTVHEKQSNPMKNVSSLSLNEDDQNTWQESKLSKPTGKSVKHESLNNVTDVLKNRRTLVPLSKTKNYNKKIGRVLTKDIVDKYNHKDRMKLTLDNGSAMDRILEAVDEVLPTEKSIGIM
ncbi:hypothetical protein PUN28_007555 [Cardiocondyla obscurior]